MDTVVCRKQEELLKLYLSIVHRRLVTLFTITILGEPR